MKQFTLLCLALISSLLLSNAPHELTPSFMQHPSLQIELDDLTKRGFTYRFLENDLIELTDPVDGTTRVKIPHELGDAEIRTWARKRGVPILEIDPNTIDTSQYMGWFAYWRRLPISQSAGQPMVVADIDQNKVAEIYGLVTIPGTPTTLEARICEVDPPSFRHSYLPYPGVPTGIVNIDNDGLQEILFSGQSGIILTDFRQQQQGDLPIAPNFTHPTTKSGVATSFAPPYVGWLDQDTLVDCLYKVAEVDSADSTLPYVLKLVVAEFDTMSHNLQRVWAMRLDVAIGRFASADFDQDGRQEFVTTGGLEGKVFVFENTGDNAYTLTYQDSLPFVNLYRITSGDLDGDGRQEFFVVATQGNGQWAVMYEADSDNQYSPKFIFHFLSGGAIDFPTYLVTDFDGDESLELLTTSGSRIFIFRSDADNSYYLWYYRHEDRLNAAHVRDFNTDGRMDLVLSKDSLDQQSRLNYYSDLYQGTPVMNIRAGGVLPSQIQLFQNYPNPFNPTTTFSFTLPHSAEVSLVVCNVLGQEIAGVAHGYRDAGNHTVVWDAANHPSGMYFARLTVKGDNGKKVSSKVIKLLLMK